MSRCFLCRRGLWLGRCWHCFPCASLDYRAVRRLAPLLALLVVGCDEYAPTRPALCIDSAERLSSGHPYATCYERAVVELRGDIALCRCPRGAVDGGAK